MNVINRGLHAFLEQRSRQSLLIVAAALIVAVSLLDYASGYYLSLGIFYILPLGILSWYHSQRVGLGAAMLCALLWYLVNATVAPPEISEAIPVWNSLVRLGYFTIIAALFASLREAYERQRQLAQTDPLTGLLNSRTFKELAHIEVARGRRQHYPVTLLYLDLDNFKALNDSQGHAAGDALLRSVGQALSTTVRQTDLVGRLGGDEFSILLSGAGVQHVESTIGRIQAAIGDVSREIVPPISATIGVATSTGVDDLETLIQRADALMYRGKLARKGSVSVDMTQDAA